jgi:acyl-homoserine lactone synthase
MMRELAMIRIVNRDNRGRYAKSLDQHFRMRREIFVRERGWTDLDRGTIETDQYDDDHTVYALSVDAGDVVIGCFRLYPTTLPHMLGDKFAWMVDGPVPQRTDINEATRFAIAKNRRDSRTYHELFIGMLEYGLSEGLSGITAVMRTLRIPVLQGIGISVQPLGLPHQIDGESNTAVIYEVCHESLTRLRKSAGVFDSVLENNAALANRVA